MTRIWELFRQALAGAFRARLRSSLTVAGIAIGCGALVSMVAFALGLQQQMERPFQQLGLLSEIRVSPGQKPAAAVQGELAKSSADAPVPAAFAAPPPLDDAALEKFRQIPGVKYAYPQMELTGVELSRGEHRATATAIAAPREIGLAGPLRELLAAGDLFTLDDAPQIVLAEPLAKNLGFETPAQAVGQQVLLSAAGLAQGSQADNFAYQRKTLPVTVIGVFTATDMGPMRFGRDDAAVIPVDLIAKLPGLVESRLGDVRRAGMVALGAFNQVVVRADDPAAVPGVVEQIDKLGYRTRTMISQLKEARLGFLFIKTLLSAVGSVAMVIAGLGIANTLLMSVLERYQEIGLYKAIGATDGDVRLLFLAEAGALGLVGGLCGLALAGVVCWGLQLGITWFLRSHDVKENVDAFSFPWWLLGGAILFSLVMSILSGLYPAGRAARVEPIDALRR